MIPYVYILKLEGGKYYVGYAINDTRIPKHGGFEGAKWTQKYKPNMVINKIYDYEGLGIALENKITLKCMKLSGWQNVRGGSWCAINLKCPRYFRHLEDWVRPPCWPALREEILSFQFNTPKKNK